MIAQFLKPLDWRA